MSAESLWVYADWGAPQEPELMGELTSQRVRGKEVFAFTYAPEWVKNKKSLLLDPNLGHYSGTQYPPNHLGNFGVFTDSAPDRWGRMLMRRREALEALEENRPVKPLFELDYLTGVHDAQRLGAIRFKREPSGPFVHHAPQLAAPPWASLRELEAAAWNVEASDEPSPAQNQWLRILLAPGSSLGGARPKASILDPSGQLWIAKFPSNQDTKDVGAWEMVVHKVAQLCSIQVPPAQLLQLANKHRTFLSKRFDRTPNGSRLHFASAMTQLGYADGANFTDGASYLEIASWIIQNGADSPKDLIELWKRMALNVFVSNTDDHLRNHGFLLTSRGWHLSPAFDLNPNEFGDGLTLALSENSNAQNPDLLREVAPFFGLSDSRAKELLATVKSAAAQWGTIATDLGISRSEQAEMANAFRWATP